MKEMNDFIKDNGITMSSEWTERNPNMADWNDANHYKCTLKRERKQMTLYYSQGYGIKGEPEAAGVLDCLASDASSIDNAGSFEDWANDHGSDEDSRKAEKTYTVCIRQAASLKKLLGDELYEELLYETERL